MTFADTAPARLDARAFLRAGIVVIFLWFGYMKFLPYEAEGVKGIAETYWLFGWLYPLLGVQGASNVIGILELTAGALIALGGRIPLAGLVGALMGVATFLVTLSFFFAGHRGRGLRLPGAGVDGSVPGQGHRASGHLPVPAVRRPEADRALT
jgi:reactive chlorine resistance protein C